MNNAPEETTPAAPLDAPQGPPLLPVVSLTDEAKNRKKSDVIIEPRDYFDLYGRHIVQNVVIEGGKPTNLLRYTIIDRVLVTMPDGSAKECEVSAPMNGFKGSCKEAFLQYDAFLEAYRDVYEKQLQEHYAKFAATRAAAQAKLAEAQAAAKTEKKTEAAAPRILGSDGRQITGGNDTGAKIAVPDHDPTLPERHVAKDGPARNPTP